MGPTHARAERQPVRVLICDDVPEFPSLVRFMLEEDRSLRVVGEAGDGDQALAQARAGDVDVVLLDLAMPDRDGLETIPVLREQAPNCAILVLSGFSAQRMGALALEAGADGYLEKGSSFSDLRAAIHEVVRSTA